MQSSVCASPCCGFLDFSQTRDGGRGQHRHDGEGASATSDPNWKGKIVKVSMWDEDGIDG